MSAEHVLLSMLILGACLLHLMMTADYVDPQWSTVTVGLSIALLGALIFSAVAVAA